MSDVRYICLSDIHFGANTSLLTNLVPGSVKIDPTEASPVLIELVKCLRAIVSQNHDKTRKPKLILNGDILELALANTNKAIMAFERFIEFAMRDDDPLFDYQIFLNPGNHDHHLWATARETQYLDFISGRKPGSFLEVPWHTTKIFMENDSTAPESEFLTRVIKRFGQIEGYKNLENAVVKTVYPNFGLMRDDGEKSVIFHHGHFIEPIYVLMSTVRTMVFPDREAPRLSWEIESENSAWIEFFWSTMGACDALASDIELVYNKLQDEKQLDQLVANLSAGVVAAIHKKINPNLWDKVKAEVLHRAIYFFLGRSVNLEVHDKNKPLSDEALQGLRMYLQGPMARQMMDERKNTMPSDVTFVFGHTHKPFEMFLQNLRVLPEWVEVYNTGGWVVDTPEVTNIHGGAVILLDDQLNTVSLRMYNEENQDEDYQIKVEEATRVGVQHSPFYDKIKKIVDNKSHPWSAFTKEVAKQRKIYAKNQATRINSP